jgi:uncharacterized protein with FMN-binding domain
MSRRFTGLVGLLAGIGLVVAARAAVGQAEQSQPVVLPAEPVQPTTATPQPTSSSTAPPAGGQRTVRGDVADTPYGPVQVAVVFDGSKIVDVRALQTPNEAYRSVRIAALATPVLRQEVLSAQSARVDSVSGATYTSAGYLQSVQYAIDHG